MDHRILIPFELPDGTPISETLADDIAGMELVALGHFALPEQTPPEAGRDQFEAAATEELTALIGALTDRGAAVTTRLVFGRARDRTIDRVAVEEGCDVVFVPGAADPETIDRLFVPLRGEDNLDAVLSFAAELALDCDAAVLLFHETEAGDRRPGEELLADATERLVAAGVDPDRIDRQLDDADDVTRDIVARAGDFDAVVLGESEPSLRERLFGGRTAAITLDADRPAFVVANLDADSEFESESEQ